MQRPIKKDANYAKSLVDYAKKNLDKGYTLDSLRWALISQGHSRIEVDKALAAAQADKAKQVQTSAKSSMQPQPQMEVQPEPEKQSFWKKLFS